MKIPANNIENYLKNIDQEKIAGCLIYGNDLISVRYYSELISKKIVANIKDPFLVTILTEEKLENQPSILAEEFYSISMFGGRKLIIIKDASSYTHQALKSLASDKEFAKKSDNFILIQANELTAKSPLRIIADFNPNIASIGCYEVNDKVIFKFTQDKLIEKNIIASNEIINLINEKHGKNRIAISLEIDKISEYFAGEKITLDQLNQLLVDQKETSFQQFVVSFADKKFQQALIHLDELISNGEEVIAILRILSNYFQKLYHLKIAYQHSDINFEDLAKEHKILYPLIIDFRRHFQNLSLKFIEKILSDLEKIEIKIKTAIMPQSLVISGYINSFLLAKIN